MGDCDIHGNFSMEAVVKGALVIGCVFGREVSAAVGEKRRGIEEEEGGGRRSAEEAAFDVAEP